MLGGYRSDKVFEIEFIGRTLELHVRWSNRSMQEVIITKYLIAQHNLMDGEYEKIVEISEYEPHLMRRLR